MADSSWGPVAKHPVGAPKRGSVRWFRRVMGAIAILVALCVVAGAGAVAYGYTTTQLPNPNKDFETATTFVYWGDGKSELGDFAIQNRQPLDFDEMPETIKQAVVAAENRTFWTDKGVSLRGMARSAYVIAKGGSLQGGSTITQQYIKILYLNSEQTVSRKYRELFLAYKLSQQKSKQEILQGYLNTIYFGHGAYGIQAASQAYFKVDAKKLTVPQAAVLASVINNPTAFDPDEKANRTRLLDRYRYVIGSMAETGDITAEQAAKYAKGLPKFPKVSVNERYGGPNGFLLKMVEQELTTAGFSSSDIQGGGLRVTTTFHEDDQKAAIKAAEDTTEQAAKASGEKESGLHAAVASVDVSSGDVLALYGGPDYVENSRNWATTARPTASTFKTFTLAAGLENGFSLRSGFQGNTWQIPGDPIPVRNEYSQNYGYSVNLIKAMADSINTAFVDLIRQLPDGKEKTLAIAEKAGAPKTRGWDAAERNIPIGTPEVSPLNQASAYATFANGGVHVAPHVVKEVKDADGNVLYKAAPQEDRAVSGDVADDVTYALSNVVKDGTARAASSLGRPVAGKTGTNGVEDGSGDNIVNSSWFVGYTHQISTAVMYVAGKSGSASLDPYRRPGDSTFFGATYPLQTWVSYMQTATDGQDVEKFDDPAYVNSYQEPTYTPPAPPQPGQPPTPIQPPNPPEPPSVPAQPSVTPSNRPTPGGTVTPRR
ncbi:transglycosylase domain-containing protein [Microlunatus antarcticus]|uniref:Membrane peptidoglycan carboxypeptidase n=2 Tax=Actinomycetes TaxID=1760 RepID=A0A7W5JZ39_9ACTN|nr:transglycosylase domain-containing protein [Microlunatus antarcticus]MBB3328811.1 membrane peptidoglycan carboxypeptidase [Microlunatus antarcticus]